MKKTFLSFALIFAFAAYAIYLRLGRSDVSPQIFSNNPPRTAPLPSIPASNPVTRIFGDNEGGEDGARTVTPPAQKPKPKSVQTPAPKPTAPKKPVLSTAPTPTPVPTLSGIYKDGQFTGPVTDAYYGNVEVMAVIQNGKISDVQFLQYPNDRRTSIEINTQAMPYLREEAIQAQSANVDIISGATQTSYAFQTSLASALAEAKI